MIVNIGKGIELDIAATDLPEASLEHVIKIGLRNILMDSHAGISQKANPELSVSQVEAQSKAVALKKLDALMRGEVRTQRVGTTKASADPVMVEASRLAWAAIKLFAQTKEKVLPKDKEGKAALVSAYLAKYPATMDTAAANIAALGGAEDMDLGDLI